MIFKKLSLRNLLAIFVIGSLFLFSCENKPEKLKIAVSYISGEMDSSNYIKWLKHIDPDAEYIAMNNLPADDIFRVFKTCNGLLLTGGEDVYPGRYGMESDTARCDGFNLVRDTLEFSLIKKALKRKIPILGVCRGQQIFNVALGGTLYVDIPTDIKTDVLHRCADYTKCFHQVKVLPNNLLSQLSGVGSGQVTTNHHQAVDRVAKDLKVMAIADDGIIESLGWKDPKEKPFLLTVQWHPERMDYSSPLAAPLPKAFLEAALKK
jgi:putative glutamine amidotransferase